MTSTGRKIAVNVFTLMRDTGFNQEEFATRLNYSYRDMYRILEGKLMLTPIEVKRIAEFFGKTKQELFHFEVDKFVPELQYLKEFSDTKNLDKILDLLDDYVDLIEAM